MSSNCAITVTVAAIALGLGLGIGHFVTRDSGFRTQADIGKDIRSLTVDSSIVPIEGSPMRGASGALATIVVFTDFMAPATKQVFKNGIERAFRAHGGSLAVVYKAYPLEQNGEASLLRAKAAACAQNQGAFWKMADALIDWDNNRPFTRESARTLAAHIGLDVRQFEKDLDDPQTSAGIVRDIALGQKLGIKGAPAIFVNGREITFRGNVTGDEIMSAVNAEFLRVEHMKVLPTVHYYLSSLVNQQLDAVAHAKDAMGRPARGAAMPLVTIVEYSDYECPFCMRVEPILDRLLTEYPDSVRIVFSHNPLPFHKNAKLASQAAIAAGNQGKFWEMHKMLFENQKNISQRSVIAFADKLGLDLARFQNDLDAPETLAVIERDIEEGVAHNISGTPNFLINGELVTGAQPYAAFKSAVERALKKARMVQRQTGLSGEALYQKMMSADQPDADGARQKRDVMRGMRRAPLREKLARGPHQKMMPAQDLSAVPLEQGKSYARGAENAPVVIYQFSEFQCPFCARVEPAVEQILRDYGSRVKIIFKNFPLRFHQYAQMASEAALAAGAQGKFWEMHKLLFENRDRLQREDLENYAKRIGLNMDEFNRALDEHSFQAQVEEEMTQGKTLGITGTPTFVINGKILRGAQPYGNFKAEIDDALDTVDKKTTTDDKKIP